MCGRFVRTTDIREIARKFDATIEGNDPGPSYNIAPRQPVVVIAEEGKRKTLTMPWGLIPSWAGDEKIASKLINARAETVTEKPSFRNAFRSRRCLIAADGFYEWRQEGGKKIPVYIRLDDGQTFAMAGLYEYHTAADGTRSATCVIITTEANTFMKPIHHRMPVILDPADYDQWLDPRNNDIDGLHRLLAPLDSHRLHAHDVSTRVNSPRIDNCSCIEPV